MAFYQTSTRRHTPSSDFDVWAIERFPRVEILYSYAEASLTPLGALLEDGVDGIVMAAPGLSDDKLLAFPARRMRISPTAYG